MTTPGVKMAWILLDPRRAALHERMPALHPGHRAPPDAPLRHGPAGLSPDSERHDLRRERAPALSTGPSDLQRRGCEAGVERGQSGGGGVRHPHAGGHRGRTCRRARPRSGWPRRRASGAGTSSARPGATRISAARPEPWCPSTRRPITARRYGRWCRILRAGLCTIPAKRIVNVFRRADPEGSMRRVSSAAPSATSTSPAATSPNASSPAASPARETAGAGGLGLERWDRSAFASQNGPSRRLHPVMPGLVPRLSGSAIRAKPIGGRLGFPPLPLGGRGRGRASRRARTVAGASPAGLAAGPLSHPLPASGERGFAAGATQDEGRRAPIPRSPFHRTLRNPVEIQAVRLVHKT